MDIERIYSRIVPTSTLALAITLLWFAFVYYPQVVQNLAGGNFVQKTFVPRAEAINYQFPIETESFRLIWEKDSGNYYAIINGQNLEEYFQNQVSAKLALKTALSANSLCDVSVFWVAAEGLSIPDKLKAEC